MKNTRFKEWKRPQIVHNKLTAWNWMVQFPNNLTLGSNTDIGAFTYINAKNGVEIGENAEIGSHCSIYSVSTIDNKEGKVTIGKYAKIGSHSTIMPGVTIGDFAVIGAHSFVNKDVAPNVTVFGVPAKNKHLVLKRSCKQTEWRVFNNEHTSTPVCTFQILNSDFFKKLFGDNK